VNVTAVGSRYVEIFWKLNEEAYDHAHTFKLLYEACISGSSCHQEYEKVPFKREVQESETGVFRTLEECQECERFRITISVFDSQGTCCGVDVYQSYPSEEKGEQQLMPEEKLTTQAAVKANKSTAGHSEKGNEDKLLYIVSAVAGCLLVALVAVLVGFCVYCRRQHKPRSVGDVEAGENKKKKDEKEEQEEKSRMPLVPTKVTYLDLGRRRTSSVHLEEPGRRRPSEVGFHEEDFDSCYPSSSGVSPASSTTTGFY